MVDDADSRDAPPDADEDPVAGADGNLVTDADEDPVAGADDGNLVTDADEDPVAGADDGTAADADSGVGGGVRSREVVVPLRLYKTVTVFSTLFAVAAVVLGFVVLDVATRRGTLDASEINPWLAAVGVALVAAGGLVYAFSSRFRAEGMRKDKDDSDEGSDNG